MGIARLGAEPPAGAVAAAHVLVGQKPRFQDITAGDDATFTVSITNTGTTVLEEVVVSNATTPSCNRGNVGPLNAGQSTSYVCTRADVASSFLNELQVDATGSGGSAGHSANAFVQVDTPELKIYKLPDTQTVRPGATAQFTISVRNSSNDTVLTDVHVDDNLSASCDLDPGVPINLAPNQKVDYLCVLTNVQAALTTIATAQATNAETDEKLLASDVAWVELLSLTAQLSAEPTVVTEPGGLITFTVNLTNPGSVPVTLVELTTNQFGNVLNAGNELIDASHNTCLPLVSLPTIQPNGGTYSCSFVAMVSGQPSSFSVILTATAKDAANANVTATTNTTVAITSLAPAMAITLGANPPVINPPSRTVAFSVRVDNTSEADTLTLTKLEDSLLGNLNGRGSCNVPQANILPGGHYQCQFSAVVTGQTGDQKSRTITATAVSDDISPETVVISDVVTVGITDEPTQEIFLPQVTDDVVGNTCADAYPLSLNRRYFFFPPPHGTQNVFRFTLPRSGNVRVELTNFVPMEGQLIVRTGTTGNCGALEVIGHNPDDSLNKTLDLGTRPGGPNIMYLIQVVNDGPTNNRNLYGLIIRFN